MIGPYYVGDIPSQAALVELNRAYEDADLSIFDNAEVSLQAPDSLTVIDLDAMITEDAVAIAWPEASPFTVAGIYVLSIALTNVIGQRERAADIEFVVEPWTSQGWHALASARRQWKGAPTDDVTLHRLLTVARDAVEAYAPTVADGTTPPIRYAQAQLMQARNVLNAASTDPGMQDGEFIIRPYPLDNHIKSLLRPRTGVPYVR